MTKEDFLKLVSGKRIVDVGVNSRGSLGDPPDSDEVLLASITLDDGSTIYVNASPHIGMDDVFASVDPPA
jgi:hypothetical protein